LEEKSSWQIRPSLPDSFILQQSVESILRVGLLYQPIVQQSNDDSFEFITGKGCFDRLQSVYPGTKIWCRVVAGNMPAKEILRLIFEENSRIRSISSIEQAYLFQLCQKHLNPEDIIELFRELGVQINPHFIARTLELLKLEIPLQVALITEKITEVVARELLKLDVMNRTAVFHIFGQLNIGGGKQRRMLMLLKDLAGREGISIVEYLDRSDIQDILNHPEMNIPQKAQSLLQLLQNLQVPTLSEAETAFAKWKSCLKLPDNCQVDHSPAFEQDTVILTVAFAHKEQMEKKLPDIKKLLE
jgi:ParB family chromosome partitioning protein